jgi:hypothetical protein
MNGLSSWDVARPVKLDAGRIFRLLPSKLLYLELGPVAKDTVDRQKLPETVRENPFFQIRLWY